MSARKKTQTASARLEELRQREVELREDERSVGRDQAETQALVAHLRARANELEGRNNAVGDCEAELKDVRAQLAAAQERAESPWTDRLEVARSAVRHIDGEVRRFVNENLRELQAEGKPDDEAARDDLVAHLEGVLAGAKAWDARAARQAGLLASVEGRSGREVPELRLEDLTKQIRAILGAGIPVPIPGARTTVASIVPRQESTEDPASAPVMRTVHE